MAVKRRLGIYFSAEALSLIELEGTKLLHHYHAPYDIFTKEESNSQEAVSEEIRLTAVLQKTLRDNKIETSDAFAALPTKDIILRSFFMPHISREEIRGAVEFEARKYIPFKIDELVYDFQVTEVKEAGSKKLRILFVGLRREILQRYFYILEQSNLRAIALEPAGISLLRALTERNLVSSKQNSVILEVNHEEGNLMILDKGLPQFIRDFKLLGTSASLLDKEEDSSFIRLLNEVRVSLDYYRRRASSVIIDKIFFCSERDLKNWAESLQKELNLAVIYLKPQDTLGLKDYVDIGLLKAFGAGLKDYVKLAVTINLSQKQVVQEAKGIRQLSLSPLALKSTIKLFFIIVAFIFLVYVFSMRGVWSLRNQIKQIKQVESKFSGQGSDELQNLIIDAKRKSSQLKEIKLRPDITPVFSAFAKLLPDKAWIDDVGITYNKENKSLSLLLRGWVYSEEPASQINIVNKFLDNLKSDVLFLKLFKNIDLNFVNQNLVDEFKLTNFEINCH